MHTFPRKLANTKIYQKRKSLAVSSSRDIPCHHADLPDSLKVHPYPAPYLDRIASHLNRNTLRSALGLFIWVKPPSLWSSVSVSVLKPLVSSQTPSSEKMTMVSCHNPPALLFAFDWFQDIPPPCIFLPLELVFFCLILRLYFLMPIP